MEKFNRAKVVSYLASLYKTAGNGRQIPSSTFTAAVCHICDDNFVEKDGEWFWLCVGIGESEETTKLYVEASELEANKKHGFCAVVAYVKWDLVHLKLKELNEAEAA